MRVESQTDHQLRFSLSFDREDLHLEYSLLGVVIHLKGCSQVGEPGGPAIPKCIVRAVLPPHAKLRSISAEPVHVSRISDETLPIAPRQPLRAGMSGRPSEAPYRRPNEQDRVVTATHARRDEKPFVEPFPTPPPVPPSRDLYAEEARQHAARVLTLSNEGLNPVATIELRPIGLTPDGHLEFRAAIDLILHYDIERDQQRPSPAPYGISSRAQAMRQVALISMTVINPDKVIDYSDLFPIFALAADYLIITDNQNWNPDTIAPAGPVAGDVVSQFARLAAWKRQRGLKARVVTISDIVRRRYGDFGTGSLDLQEVIRKFLKMAYAEWGVAWVLLGGDTGIVPIRRVASDIEGAVVRQSINPPPENSAYWTGSHMRIHATNLGDWWAANSTNLLMRPDTGLLIPYDAAGTSGTTSRGWYFVADDTYAVRSTVATNFVRVNGPAAEINGDLQFLYMWNIIPTDLYYSSLVGPHYGKPGTRDWDLNGNGVFGQYGGSNLDGLNFNPNVSLGRAPVRSEVEAKVFVDKVIAYERFERPDGTSLPTDWTSRVVLASTNWGGQAGIPPTASDPPEDGCYHHPAGQNHAFIKLAAIPEWNWSLLAAVSGSDLRLLPYRTDAATAGRGWYFVAAYGTTAPNIIPVPLPGGGLLFIPFPSLWVVVYGAPEELEPAQFILNNTELDGSLADQEELRQQLKTQMPGFNEVRRLYQDITDMTPAQIAAGPVEPITRVALSAALNAGPHIVSLSGHGSNWGCCDLDQNVADSLSNGYQTFIVYADSCLTNQVDGDAMSEHLLRNPNGGAVGYVGNTRFSWIGVGDDFQRRFFGEWSSLAGNAHLGLLFDTRAGLYDDSDAYFRWVKLALNLAGDPEMSLWWRSPLIIRVPQVVFVDRLKWVVDPPEPPDPLFKSPYVRDWGQMVLHLRQGDVEQSIVGRGGEVVEMALEAFRAGSATLTVSSPGHRPFVREVQLATPQVNAPAQ